MPANYVRNAAKVVVDAYTGQVTLYAVDPTEPVTHAWMRVFPRMFQPMTAMPAGLQAHIRFPEQLFNTVSEVYRLFHITDPRAFYDQADLWEIPVESLSIEAGAGTANPMEAYYQIMALPGADTPEYLLIRPYTPAKKKNLVAWLSVRNDLARFGELQAYTFPRQQLPDGPEQIESLFKTVPEISEAFSLWSRSGSEVVKGNLLVIPLAKSLLYVVPIFLQADQSQIPQLQRVIVADQDRIVMRRTLEEALAALTGGRAVPAPAAASGTTPTPTPGATPTPAAAAGTRARTALDHFNRAQEAARRGDWAAYGAEIERVRQELEALNQEQGK
jgi:uncharacterized membrane protein (UPF0182 family)